MGRAKGSKDAHKRTRRKNTTKEMAAKKAKRHRKEAAPEFVRFGHLTYRHNVEDVIGAKLHEAGMTTSRRLGETEWGRKLTLYQKITTPQ